MSDNKMSPEFKGYLIESLKNSAMTVHDLAEQFVGDYLFTGDLDINITIGCSTMDRYPEISINKIIYPNLIKQKEYMNRYDKIRSYYKSPHIDKKEVVDSINPYNEKQGHNDVGDAEQKSKEEK